MNRTGRNGSRKRPSPYSLPISLVEALEPRTLLSGSQDLGLAIDQFIQSHFGEHHNASPTAIADLTGSPTIIAAVSGIPFAGDIAILTAASTPINLHNYRVTIDWGDTDTTTRGFLRVAPDDLIHLQGYHRYPSAGNFPITATLTQYAQGTPTGSPLQILTSASVTQNSPSGLNLSAIPHETFTGIVGSFPLPSTAAAAPSAFKAFINWGDNAWPSQGTLTVNTNGTCSITGEHTYAREGTYRISIFIVKEITPPTRAASRTKSPEAPTTPAEQFWQHNSLVTTVFSTATVTDSVV